MFARILFVGAMPLAEADPSFRLCAELRRAGHAVQLCDHLLEDGDAARELASMCDTFRPSLILWDADALSIDEACASVLSRMACCLAVLTARSAGDELDRGGLCAMFGPGLPDDAVFVTRGKANCLARGAFDAALSCAPDETYMEARAATEGLAGRSGIAFLQKRTEERAQLLARVFDSTGLSAAFFDPSWGTLGNALAPGERPAFSLRSVRFAVYCSGVDDGPTYAQVAMRIAEGCLVLVERGALPSAGCDALTGALVLFEPNELPSVVASYEADPASYERDLNRQRDAVTSLPNLGESLARLLDSLDRRQSAAGGAAVLAMEKPARVFVLNGWIGARNYGDDLLARFTMARVAQRYPEAVFRVLGASLPHARLDFGVEAFEPTGGASVERALEGATALLYLGGLLFDDPSAVTGGVSEFMLDPYMEPSFQASLALFARAQGIPAIGLGIGAGPLSRPAAQMAVRLMSLARMTFLVRDAHTSDLLLGAGVPAELVSLKADLVLGSGDYIRAHASRGLPGGLVADGYFVVSLRDCALNPPSFADDMAHIVRCLIEQTGLCAAFVPFDVGDVAIHARVIDILREQGVQLRSIVSFEERLSGPDILAVIAGSRMALGMRLHCSILHHVLGKLALGIDYNDKVHAHYEGMGQLDVLLALGSSAEDADAAIERVLADQDQRLSVISGHVARASRLVDEAFDELFSLIDATAEGDASSQEICEWKALSARDGLFFYPRTVSRSRREEMQQRCHVDELEQRLAQMSDQLEQGAAEVGRLAQEVCEVRASHSYRLGNALMRIPAYFKRRLQGGASTPRD